MAKTPNFIPVGPYGLVSIDFYPRNSSAPQGPHAFVVDANKSSDAGRTIVSVSDAKRTFYFCDAYQLEPALLEEAKQWLLDMVAVYYS